ncbi:Nn.00g022060.m01.CDS01 [Neocucurbitaria sp. VM-36]
MSHYEHSLEQRQHSLPRRRSKYLLRRSEGGKVTNPIMISRGSPRLGESLAMQRWQNSPPEEEAASLSAIYNALESRSSSKTVDTDHTQHTDAFYKHRGHSSTTSIDSGASESSLRSGNSSQSATSKSNRRSQTPRIRSRAKGKAKNMDAADRIFKCTFCCDTFKHKYDWSRHEKSLHLNMEEWICAPHGASAVLPLTGRVHCAYCSALDPTPEHLQQHNHSACSDGSSTPRVFRRKDHLVQHLRLVHGLDTLPLIDDWKVESTIPVVSRCGFCNITLNSWNERTDHLGAHFRNGKTMADWHGEHDFDPVVTARLTHVYPPYLIASQSLTLVPFSATDPTAIDHTKQLLSRIGSLAVTPSSPNLPASTDCQVQTSLPSDAEPLPTQQELHTVVFADMLTRHLSHFARQQMLAGIIPTDEMFQRESRRLLYQDGEDEWNQTVADSPEWLQEFRQRTGFGREDDARIC